MTTLAASVAGGAFRTIGAAKSLFGSPDVPKTPEAATPPPAPPPTPMPDPDDTLLLANKKRKAAASSARSGRQSTILSDGNRDTLGAG